MHVSHRNYSIGQCAKDARFHMRSQCRWQQLRVGCTLESMASASGRIAIAAEVTAMGFMIGGPLEFVGLAIFK